VRFTTENHRCEFRTPDESVLLEYAALTGGRPHYIYPQHELVERLCEALTAAGGEIRFGHAVRVVTQDSIAHALGLPDSLIDFTADTTRAIAQLQYSNTFARTPDVKFVFSHAGGTVPYLTGRFGIVDEMRVIPGAEARATAAETFRRLYWDTALSWSDQVLRMLRDIAGIDRVLFGSDYSYLRRDLAVSSRRHIEANPELTTSERTAILGGTAAKLIPRLASLRSRTQRQAS